MRDETADWLGPMIEALDDSDHTTALVQRLMMEASMPVAEAPDSPMRTYLMQHPPPPGIGRGSLDWLRFGQLLRHELGWDDTYPALPEFPELSAP